MKHSRRGALVAILIAALFGSNPLPAQSAAVRASIEAFADSLGWITAGEEARRVERRSREDFRTTGDGYHAMRLGLVLHRRAQLDDGRLFDRARDSFKRASALEPAWAYPHLWWGRAERGKAEWLAAEPLNIGTRVGHGAFRSAVSALIKAVEMDPDLTAALIDLDAIATALRDTTVARQTLFAMRNAAARNNDDAALLLLLGRWELAMGDRTSSIAVLQRYRASGENPARAGFELARSLLTAGNPNGDSLYFSAALTDDSATLLAIRADLRPIAYPEELALFDGSRGADRQQFLREFWTDRARRDLQAPGDRLREHYRRLQFAHRHFALSNNRRYYGLRDLYRAPEDEVLDDRGVIYVRQGEPDKRLAPLLFGLLPNETWLYHRADGDLLLHFSAGGEMFEGGDLGDYRLVPSVFSLRGSRTPQEMLLASRFEMSDLYQRIMSWGPHGSARMRAEERAWGVESAAIGTSTDAQELHFLTPLDIETELLIIGRREGLPLLQAIYTLPAAVRAGTPVRFRIALFDSGGRVRHWRDTTAISESIGMGLAGGRFELPVASGRWFYRAAFQVGDAGRTTPRDTVVVPDLHHALAMSGLGLGRSRENIAWRTGPADTARLSPDHEFESNGELRLYYEVYGGTDPAQYRTTVSVVERRGARRGRTRLQFTFLEEGGGETTRINRTIRLTGLEPRDYWLEVQTGDHHGLQVVSRKGFRVVSVAR